ncbi:MAG TPA: hypothetical protein VLX30_02875 [Burkholderiales bacterium]|nr:hypothetical protein [Burkholderiales bacterium]
MRRRLAWRLALPAVLFLLRAPLEAGMSVQMLVQIPLLVAAGALLAGALPPRPLAAVQQWNAQGVSGLVLATLAILPWMLPLSLDAAASRPIVDGARHLALPLLAGVPLALGWRRAGFVVRGVFLLELVASCFRLGWLYLAAPVRLCNNYGLGDQQRLGQGLLMLGAALVTWIGLALLIPSRQTRRSCN